MGTASYVVSGKGHPGLPQLRAARAGREYSRTKARQTFDREQLRAAMVGIE